MYRLKINNIMNFFMLSGLLACQVNAMYRSYQLNPKKPKITPEKFKQFSIKQQRIEEQVSLRAQSLHPDEFFIYDANTGQGIAVDKEFVLSHRAMSGKIRYISDQMGVVSVSYPIETVENVFSLFKLCNNDKVSIDVIKQGVANKMANFSIAELVDICNAVDDLGFGHRECDQFISGEFVGRLANELQSFIGLCIDIAVYAHCDQRNLDFRQFSRIPCDNEESAQELFDELWNNYQASYDTLAKLDPKDIASQSLISNTLSTLTITYLYPMNIIQEKWPHMYQQLKVCKNIKTFLDIIKNLVDEEIRQRKLRDFQKEQAKLYWWQRKWF